MSRDWNAILEQHLHASILRWLDSSHEGEKLPTSVILTNKVMETIKQVEAERIQYEDELSQSYNEPYHEEEEPPFP